MDREEHTADCWGQVGNEFSSVEALWSQFENVMAKDPDAEGEGQHAEEGEEGHSGEETEIHEGNARSR